MRLLLHLDVASSFDGAVLVDLTWFDSKTTDVLRATRKDKGISVFIGGLKPQKEELSRSTGSGSVSMRENPPPRCHRSQSSFVIPDEKQTNEGTENRLCRSLTRRLPLYLLCDIKRT